MRSLSTIIFTLALLATGVQSVPDQQNHQGGLDRSCSDSTSSLKSVTGGALTSTSSSLQSVPTTTSTATTPITSSTTYTTTITSTTTATVTISGTGSACALSSATTGIPLTTPIAVPTNNNTTIALNTTTSTKHVTNVTNPTAATIAPNGTVPKPTVSPPISGFKGAAAGLSSQSPASVFALGCLVLMAALLV